MQLCLNWELDTAKIKLQMGIKDQIRLIGGRTEGDLHQSPNGTCVMSISQIWSQFKTISRQVNHSADEFDHIPGFDHVKVHTSSPTLHASWYRAGELMLDGCFSFLSSGLNKNAVFICMWQYLGNYLGISLPVTHYKLMWTADKQWKF